MGDIQERNAENSKCSKKRLEQHGSNQYATAKRKRNYSYCKGFDEKKRGEKEEQRMETVQVLAIVVITAVAYLTIVAGIIGIYERRKARQRAERLYMQQVERSKQKLMKELMSDCTILEKMASEQNVSNYKANCGESSGKETGNVDCGQRQHEEWKEWREQTMKRFMQVH